MPSYIQTEVRFRNGDIRVEKYFSLRYGRKAARGGNVSSTSSSQKEINERRARQKREDLIANNFVDGDIWATLTYPRDLMPETPEAAHKKAAAFMKKIKSKYPDVKYFFKTETGRRSNYHHHMFFSWGGHTKEITVTDKRSGEEVRGIVPLDERDLKELWRKHIGMDRTRRGGGDFKIIYDLSDDLLAYFGKRPRADRESDEYTPEKYSHSRNLEKPVVVKKVISNRSWRKTPRPRKGYEIIKLINGTDAVGFEKQTYILRKRC